MEQSFWSTVLAKEQLPFFIHSYFWHVSWGKEVEAQHIMTYNQSGMEPLVNIPFKNNIVSGSLLGTEF